ncbi:hypothetical protein ACFUC1_13675 [Pedococcus sp. NPDC057267]|uniref:hypothetical protein n=1 Tax=Pedococcus sp. NPDC057267 TaxID=3346077 RepID=UPI0036353B26
MQPADLADHGVISTASLRSIGIGPSAIRRRVRQHELLPLVRGWYAVRLPGSARAPWEGADRFETAKLRHALVAAALVRSFEGRAVASHASAVVLHGGRLWQSDLSTAHLARVADDHSRHRRGAVIHPSTGQPPNHTPTGLATVPMAWAVVQVGLVPVVDGRPSPMESLVCADWALAAQLVTRGELDVAIDAHGGHPHVDAVRRLLGGADGRHESVGETRLAHALRHLGYTVVPQLEVRVNGRSYFADFALDAEPVLVEFDGLGKYLMAANGVPTAADPASRARFAVAAQRRRQDELEQAGYEFARIAWADLDDLGVLRAKVERARDRARRRRTA